MYKSFLAQKWGQNPYLPRFGGSPKICQVSMGDQKVWKLPPPPLSLTAFDMSRPIGLNDRLDLVKKLHTLYGTNYTHLFQEIG